MSNNVNDGQRPKRTTIQGRRFNTIYADADGRREAEELLSRLSSARLHASMSVRDQRATQSRSADR